MVDLHCYYSLSSPWAYLGGPRAVEIARRHGARLILKPFDFQAVAPGNGGVPLRTRPASWRAYHLAELDRWRRHLGMPLNLKPKHYPEVVTDPDWNKRPGWMVIAADLAGKDAVALSHALLEALWAKERDIARADVRIAIADGLGLDGRALQAAETSEAVQARYRQYTEEARQLGVFGAPTYVVGDERFWGQDRLDFVEAALARANGTRPAVAGLHDHQVPREIDPESGLVIGPKVPDARPARRPQRTVLEGRYCRLEPIEPRHAEQLYAASSPPDAAKRFRYLFEPPPASRAEVEAWIAKVQPSEDPLVFAVIDKRTGRCEGRQTYMRITPEHQVIEIGSIYWGPAIARTAVTTEANYLFARHAFEDLGYRRYEWKCDALNAPSRRAAERFGFTYEGHFRRAVINKGRSRDTSWYAMIDEDWPALKAAYERWLSPANFDAAGRQRESLGALTAAALAGRA